MLMNEIEKMFNRVGLLGIAEQNQLTGEIIGCKPMPFTTEKQLELVKWLFNSINLLCLSPLQHSKDFENDLAGLINCLWQDLEKEDRQQIRRILE